jgi:hypothetical protein
MIFKNIFAENFCKKLAKIAENCDHNIGPWPGRILSIRRLLILSNVWKISEANFWANF